MSPATFIAGIVKLGGTVAKPEKINTNNAWGFGGWYGKQWTATLDGHVYKFQKGRVSTRHQGTFPREDKVIIDDKYKGFEPKTFFRCLNEGARSYDELIQRYEASCKSKKPSRLSEAPTD